jgi:hypothetical protein
LTKRKHPGSIGAKYVGMSETVVAGEVVSVLFLHRSIKIKRDEKCEKRQLLEWYNFVPAKNYVSSQIYR